MMKSKGRFHKSAKIPIARADNLTLYPLWSQNQKCFIPFYLLYTQTELINSETATVVIF